MANTLGDGNDGDVVGNEVVDNRLKFLRGSTVFPVVVIDFVEDKNEPSFVSDSLVDKVFNSGKFVGVAKRVTF